MAIEETRERNGKEKERRRKRKETRRSSNKADKLKAVSLEGIERKIEEL